MLKNKLINAAICEVQSYLVRKYGDCVEVSNIIRQMTADMKLAGTNDINTIAQSVMAQY